MARRSGKASRQSRQRRTRRAATRPAAPQTPPSAQPEAAPPAPDASFEAADAAARVAGASAFGARPAARQGRSHPADPRFQVSGPSRLSERAAAEYHYVVRDLRNIGVLVAIMTVLLVLATVVIRGSGIGQA